MSRVLRKTGTATIVITASSDPDSSYPATKFGQASPTKVYKGDKSDAELATLLENVITEWAQQSFPKEVAKQFFDLVSVAVVVA